MPFAFAVFGSRVAFSASTNRERNQPIMGLAGLIQLLDRNGLGRFCNLGEQGFRWPTASRQR